MLALKTAGLAQKGFVELCMNNICQKIECRIRKILIMKFISSGGWRKTHAGSLYLRLVIRGVIRIYYFLFDILIFNAEHCSQQSQSRVHTITLLQQLAAWSN
jgi:hypothetical protein